MDQSLDVGETVNSEVKTVIAGFCQTARSIGAAAAERSATVHLVAAAAYLADTAGPNMANQIISAVLASIV